MKWCKILLSLLNGTIVLPPLILLLLTGLYNIAQVGLELPSLLSAGIKNSVLVYTKISFLENMDSLSVIIIYLL